jgi:pimeloyl-ACP methyl ester carboxylesterase
VRTLSVLSVPHPAAMTQSLTASDQLLRSYYVGLFQLPLVPERLLLARDGAALRRVLRGGGLPDDAVDRYVERMQEPGALTSALGWYRALPWSRREPVGTVRVPTLHVWSTEDAHLSWAGIERSARFVDAPYRLEVLDGVSHWIPELAPDRVAELVVEQVRSGGH